MNRLALSRSQTISKFIQRASFTTSLRAFEAPNKGPEIPNICFTGTNDSMAFPCLDHLANRTRSLDGGPEPNYEKVVSGYEKFHYDKPFQLDHGGLLPEFDLAYETWGNLNAEKSNAILIHTGLSGSSHAKSHLKNENKGWWEKFIGPGGVVDTDKYFVICTNVLGGCYGSTGPSSIDPSDGQHYATRFPILTVFDMVRAQFKLLDYLGIQTLHASVGSSMGGMQSLASGTLYSDRVKKVISISSCAKSHPSSIALRHIQRQVLMTDPNWSKGNYYKGIPPHVGMKMAREVATITYRSGPEWENRFGLKRKDESAPPSFCPDYLIETYLDHQGEKFCLDYDPNSLLYVSKAMDMFDLSQSNLVKLSETSKLVKHLFKTEPSKDLQLDLRQGLSLIKAHTLVLGVQSDILFPFWQQKEIASEIKKAGNTKVNYFELDSLYGHDTFLIELNSVGAAVKGHLDQTI
ncbi:homoserine acetyltransferase [Conidiobolus coronatus NRRL 28638]|uniref:Homoserine acetyltransferase n=1 Tax=Conidiobolus coronatus (strain ATCC 28846 / CBS 209.66 / NRRL 28638) TaxID=796925 RepID=A0A137P1G3_CONC2|nr:homoserine acetyltransferase [Conidiobolus coronatus NRRL 28638]|eukprot:KXN68887.1 homoserine acetyltransferase [Conidiobolus coronatus NRRL 28638]